MINLDATYISLKRDTVSKEAVYIAIDSWEDGLKEVLTYKVEPTECAFVREEVRQSLKEQGVGNEDVLLFISDALKEIAARIFATFPDTKF